MEISFDEHSGMAAVQVRADRATWTYQTGAGGFSSLVGPDGEEWIGHAPGPDGAVPAGSGGAANVYRGIPNLVYPENVGHPGHEHCRSNVDRDGSIAVISTESLDGEWAWQWRVSGGSASLSVTRAPRERRYWFLYEGTPGGRFDPEQSFWGSDTEGRRSDAPNLFEPSPAGGPAITPRTWAYFGHRECARVLLCTHNSAAGGPSFFAYMRATANTGMVVFGFGRDQMDGPLPTLAGPHEFTVALIEATDHHRIAEQAHSARPL